MLKKWHENRPFTFGAVFIFFYMTIPILDAAFIIPTMKPVCNGQITNQQVRMCTDWIKNKEKVHVPKSPTSIGRLYGNPKSDSQLQWEREIGTFGTPQSKK